MFGVSFGELFVIFLVLLCCVPPKDIPVLMGKVGYILCKIRSFVFGAWSEVKGDVDVFENEVRLEVDDIVQDLNARVSVRGKRKKSSTKLTTSK